MLESHLFAVADDLAVDIIKLLYYTGFAQISTGLLLVTMMTGVLEGSEDPFAFWM